MGNKNEWRNLPDAELEAELMRREIEYRNFADAQQLQVNLKAARISAIKSELFKRRVDAQKVVSP